MADKTQKILRGRLLSFSAAPKGPDDTQAYSYIEDGALLIDRGKIAACGEFADVASSAGEETAIIDHRPHLILPGFIDTHIHFPQAQVIASWADQLLDWLNDYTFPAEMPDAADEAMRLLHLVREVGAGAPGEAYGLLQAIELGQLLERLYVRPHGPNALTGKKVSRGAELGQEITHGTKEEKQARWDEYCDKFDAVYPDQVSKKTAAYKRVAFELGVAWRTIQDAVLRRANAQTHPSD